MGTSSLILGVIAFFVAFSFFKDLSLILAALGVILGIVGFFRKKHRGVCVAGIILGVISLVVIFSSGNTTAEVSSSSTETGTQNCKIGDTITVKTASDEYTLQVTDIKESAERNEFADQTPTQVFLIDYNYACNKTTDGVFVSDMNFKVVDENGEIGYTYPINYTDAQRITAGTSCKAQMAFGVNNQSKKLKLQFYDNMFNGTPTAVYEIEL